MAQALYQSLEGAVYFPQPQAGYLRISGSDRSSFLQRQSTNDISGLSPSRAIVTVLTSPTARILDVLSLIEESPAGAEDLGAVGAVCLPGLAADTARYLKSRIFFMDKVTLSEASAGFFQADLEGRRAGELLAGFGLPLELDRVAEGEIAGERVRAVGQRGLAGSGCRLLAPAQAAGKIVAAIEQAGAARLSAGEHEILRVEAGLPAAGAELTGEYTPLEAGLGWAISATKGCYTGQEVIARQVTYDKVTQHLAGLRLAATVEVGERAWAEGRPVGKITSCAESPVFGPIALAILKRPFHEPGAVLRVGGEEGGIRAVVSSLPFED